VEFAVSFAGIYDQYLGGVAIDDLDYVGITEEFDLSCRSLEAVLGRPLVRKRERTGDGIDYRAWLRDRGALEAIERTQTANRRAYDAARRRFDLLCRIHL
jgi:hypothetical protein